MPVKGTLQLIPLLRSLNVLWLLPPLYHLCAHKSATILEVSTLLRASDSLFVDTSEERKIWRGHVRLCGQYRLSIEGLGWFHQCYDFDGEEACTGLSSLGLFHIGSQFDIFAPGSEVEGAMVIATNAGASTTRMCSATLSMCGICFPPSISPLGPI
ncbi:hypothetical protein BDV98DRAFT_573429 [Pterulicium gracile]|uniref:Uncharacterized protein n=1 Tax=Pterulicium gracile TaxID=1884261 RepID=A0A5C3QD24_9AGAR|nr:hypothetical protein BDV98DRAFT_573429 [Pterula gracilis]